MKTANISSKFVRSQMRLDAKFHLSDGLLVRRVISNSPYKIKQIRDLTADIYCPGIFKRNYVNSGIPFLGGSDIQKRDFKSSKYLLKKHTPNNETLKVCKGWTLVTCGGTIGETVFANKMLAKCWASQHVMRVVPLHIKEGVLYAYLGSKYGKLLLTTNIYGSVIPTLNADNIGTLPIPEFPDSFQCSVDSLIQESATLRENATSLLIKAEQMLKAEASLRDLTSDDYDYFGPRTHERKVSCFIRNKKDIDIVTINAFNHSERIRKTKQLISCSTLPLKEVLHQGDVFSTGSFPRIEVKEGHGVMLINQSDIFDTIIKGKYISKRNVRLSNLVEYGEVLIAGVGTLGENESFCRVIYANEELENQLVSGEFIRMKTEGIPSGYLFTWLNSDYGFRFIRNTQAGTKLCRPIPKLLLRIPVPIIDKDKMEEIDQMVRKAHTMRYQANQKELKAITMVEAEIEKWKN